MGEVVGSKRKEKKVRARWKTKGEKGRKGNKGKKRDTKTKRTPEGESKLTGSGAWGVTSVKVGGTVTAIGSHGERSLFDLFKRVRVHLNIVQLKIARIINERLLPLTWAKRGPRKL